MELEAGTTSLKAAFVAGGSAGLSVDIVLYPLDTIKTRLQSQQGFAKAGGFRGIYSGIGSAAVGSIPTATLFFLAYEAVKNVGYTYSTDPKISPLIHMIGASVGEGVACVARVPTEVVKQRAQANPGVSTLAVFRNVASKSGIRGFFQGYSSTVMREIPFSFVQFPLWEYFKKCWSRRTRQPTSAWESSVAGALAGGIAAGITTPLDVAKTRIMLAERKSLLSQGSILYAMTTVRKEKGINGLFAGIVPRVMWISIGGAIFLGVYDGVRNCFVNFQDDMNR